MSTTKVQNLTALGAITPGDTIVGEKVPGTTGLLTYAVDITADPAPVLGGNLSMGGYSINSVTPTELGYVAGVTGAVQTQLNTKTTATSVDTLTNKTIDGASNTVTGLTNTAIAAAAGITLTKLAAATASSALVSDASGFISASATTSTEVGYMSGVTSGVQAQLNAKSPAAGSTSVVTLGTVTTGVWNASTIPVPNGGSGRITATAYAPILGGVTASGVHQSMASGSAGQIMQSGGISSVPTWTTPTYPAASGTSRKILVSDGTNMVYSTETYAAPSTSGKIMQSDGTNWTSATPTGTGTPVLATSPTLVTPHLGTAASGVLTNCTGYPGALKSFQIFTSGSAATYTKPANVVSILVELIGGGGGGGGSLGGGATTAAAGGGGAGGYARLWVPSAASTYTYTVGGGGAGGTAGANNGSTGATTTFSASSLQATGGAGGVGASGAAAAAAQFNAGGLGGVGSNGNINAQGAPGAFGLTVVGFVGSGVGGSSHMGGGGSSVANAVSAGVAGGNYGSGGSGASSSTVSFAGGAGSAGIIIVWEFS